MEYYKLRNKFLIMRALYHWILIAVLLCIFQTATLAADTVFFNQDENLWVKDLKGNFLFNKSENVNLYAKAQPVSFNFLIEDNYEDGFICSYLSFVENGYSPANSGKIFTYLFSTKELNLLVDLNQLLHYSSGEAGVNDAKYDNNSNQLYILAGTAINAGTKVVEHVAPKENPFLDARGGGVPKPILSFTRAEPVYDRTYSVYIINMNNNAIAKQYVLEHISSNETSNGMYANNLEIDPDAKQALISNNIETAIYSYNEPPEYVIPPEKMRILSLNLLTGEKTELPIGGLNAVFNPNNPDEIAAIDKHRKLFIYNLKTKETYRFDVQCKYLRWIKGENILLLVVPSYDLLYPFGTYSAVEIYDLDTKNISTIASDLLIERAFYK